MVGPIEERRAVEETGGLVRVLLCTAGATVGRTC